MNLSFSLDVHSGHDGWERRGLPGLRTRPLKYNVPGASPSWQGRRGCAKLHFLLPPSNNFLRLLFVKEWMEKFWTLLQGRGRVWRAEGLKGWRAALHYLPRMLDYLFAWITFLFSCILVFPVFTMFAILFASLLAFLCFLGLPFLLCLFCLGGR